MHVACGDGSTPPVLPDLHQLQELDDHLGGGADEDLPANTQHAMLAVGNVNQSGWKSCMDCRWLAQRLPVSPNESIDT